MAKPSGGLFGGAALILGLNTLRIGTLGLVASSPAWFNTLHVYVWPGALTLAIAGYVFAWMRLVDERRTPIEKGRAAPAVAVGQAATPCATVATVRRAHGCVSACVCHRLTALSREPYRPRAGRRCRPCGRGGPRISRHQRPRRSQCALDTAGRLPRDEECIFTPLIPIYVAAICAYSTTWRRLVLGVLATLPLFLGLGIVRLLVVALPGVAASPIFFVHAFYQLLAGALAVFLAAVWRHGGKAAFGPALAGVVVGVLFVRLLGPLYTGVVTSQAGAPLDDPQGAIALLPTFQVGLYLALCVAAFAAVGWQRFIAGLAVLGLTQTASLLALQALTSYAGLTAHVRDVRGWAIAGPVLIFAAVVNIAPPRR